MKTITSLLSATLLGLQLLHGAGCGRPDGGGTSTPPPPPPKTCGNCAPYESCMPSGLCGLDPNSTWAFGVDSAVIATRKANGDAWDTLGGAPDPFVMLDARRTSTRQDTFTPSWQQGASYTAATLLRQGVTVTVYDEDLASNDLIGGPSTVVPTEADLRRGTLTLTNLGQAERITFLLAPQ